MPLPILGDTSPSLYAYTRDDGTIVLSEECLELPNSRILGTIAHERMHLVLKSISRGHEHGCNVDTQSWYTWNVATDAFINDMLTSLGYELPPGCIYLSDLKDSYKIDPKDSEELYDYLIELNKEDLEKEIGSENEQVSAPMPMDMSDTSQSSGESGDEEDDENGSDSNFDTGNEGAESKSPRELVEEFVEDILNSKVVDLSDPNIGWGGKLEDYQVLGNYIQKRDKKTAMSIISVAINKLNCMVQNITMRTYAKLNRRCPVIKGERRSTLKLNLVLDVSGSMWVNNKLNNAVALTTSMYSYLRNLGYEVDSYLLDTRLNKIPSMTYKEIVKFRSDGGNILDLCDDLPGVRVIITDAIDAWVPKRGDKNLILIYDGPKRSSGVRCSFETGKVIEDKII